jgi:hypothetical protein
MLVLRVVSKHTAHDGLPFQSLIGRNKIALDTPKNLLIETSMNLESEAVHVALIKAQRIELKPKIALATQESVRAYTIWHSFKFGGKRFNFNRNEKPEGMKLSMMLMEPILVSFNIRFTGDATLIQSLVGTPWDAIDQYMNGLWDDSLPADLILTCMLDTILIMAYALLHQRINGKLKSRKDNAQPLSASDIEKACEWYTTQKENRQAETHAKIKELLAENGSPKDSSIANLQMKIIETVELQSDTAGEDLLYSAVMKGTTAVMKGTTAVVQGTTAAIGGATAAIADATMAIGGATFAIGGATGAMMGDATGAIMGGATGIFGGAVKNMKGIRKGLFR